MGTASSRCTRAACHIALVFLLTLTAVGQKHDSNAIRSNRSPLSDSRQALVVMTDGWDSVTGTLQRYERPTLTSAWKPIGKAIPVVVGENGLAWGSGLQGSATGNPVKHEGDGKAPAGVFRLGLAFGQSPTPVDGTRLSYRFLSTTVECVDDPVSSHYNQLVSKQDVAKPDWNSSEKMWEEPLYKWGVVVQYNTPNTQPGAGSCIFLHIWKAADTGTAGCTAMPEAELTSVMKWLDPAQNPALVQVPKAEYERLKAEWRLP